MTNIVIFQISRYWTLEHVIPCSIWYIIIKQFDSKRGESATSQRSSVAKRAMLHCGRKLVERWLAPTLWSAVTSERHSKEEPEVCEKTSSAPSTLHSSDKRNWGLILAPNESSFGEASGCFMALNIECIK